MAYDGIALFSGGLDSILAAKVLQEQGLSILCLHFVSPFFGNLRAVRHWRKIYDLEIECLDVGVEFIKMLLGRPAHGVGKTINPCVDCKILLLREAKKYMLEIGAKFVATGEVLGQRPMSQRRDTLFLISRDAQIRDHLLRPLCAKHLPPTPMEDNGLVSREKLHGISGRGRNEQLALAQKYKLSEIPSPAGGCRLTEKENARRYWQILKACQSDFTEDIPERDYAKICRDFMLANIGRQLWRDGYWLSVGRNKADNESLLELADKTDTLLKLCDFSGPIALAHDGATWPDNLMESACAFMAACSPRAAQYGARARVLAKSASNMRIYEVLPNRVGWDVPSWEECREEISAWGKL